MTNIENHSFIIVLFVFVNQTEQQFEGRTIENVLNHLFTHKRTLQMKLISFDSFIVIKMYKVLVIMNVKMLEKVYL